MSQFTSLGFSTYKPSGHQRVFLRWCRGGNFDPSCHQNMSATTSMIADHAVTAEKVDARDIVLTRTAQVIRGTKRFTSNLLVDRDIDVEGDIQVGGRVYEGGNLLLPPGTILPFGGASAPNGFLTCNGAAVSRTTYSALFSAIGTTYGVGDGSTTFTLPNLSGRFPVGVDGATFSAVGAAGGAETKTLDVTEIPSHTHTGTTEANGTHIHDASTAANGTHAHTSNAVGGQNQYGLALANGSNTVTDTDSSQGELNVWTVPGALTINDNGSHTHDLTVDANGSHTHDFTTDTTGGGSAFSLLNPYLTILYVIKV